MSALQSSLLSHRRCGLCAQSFREIAMQTRPYIFFVRLPMDLREPFEALREEFPGNVFEVRTASDPRMFSVCE